MSKQKFKRNFILETSHFILRSPSSDDIPAIFQAAQVPGFTDGMQWNPPETEDELIAPFEANIRAWEEGRAYCFSMIRRSDDEFLGRISIRRNEAQQEEIWNFGFFTVPRHQGNGYMTEAVKAVLEFGFNELHARKIEASYALWNLASERVLQRNGMIHQSYNPNGFKKNGEWVEENTLAITLLEWTQINAVNRD